MEPRVAHCVFCDDVRFELGNKMSLMGMYQADIIIGANPPTVLPKLVIAIWVLSDIDDPIQKMTTIVLAPPNQTEFIRAEIEGAAPPSRFFEDSKKIIIHQVIPLINFPIMEAGVIEVLLETDRGSFRAGRLRVSFVDPEDNPGSFGTTPAPIA